MMLPDRFFDDMFEFDVPRTQKERMECDVYEEDGNYVVEASIAGFKKEDIKIEAEDGNIIITAEKKEDGSIIITAEKNEDKEDKSDRSYLRRERHFHSRTQRAFYLGDIDEDNIKATFDNGVLKVTVPKKQIESNRKLIDIE